MILTPDNPGVHCGRIATIGSFDGVHRGHRYMLEQLIEKSRALRLRSSVITFVSHPRAVTKGHAPILTDLDLKLRLINSVGVDDVVLLEFNTRLRSMSAVDFMEYIKRVFGVEALLLGFNNRFGCDRMTAFDDYRRKGAEIGVAVYGADEYNACSVSSTAVRRAIEDGDVERAALMLGREYALSGKVVHGRALGRTIGFPTANIEQLGQPCIVPARGVYAVDIMLPGDDIHRAIMNIGHRPTVDNGNDDTLEVHVLDYDGDLYGKTVVVKFLKRLRDERKFDSIALLREQLEADASVARTL